MRMQRQQAALSKGLLHHPHATSSVATRLVAAILNPPQFNPALVTTWHVYSMEVSGKLQRVGHRQCQDARVFNTQ
jgi:hypothetical protein